MDQMTSEDAGHAHADDSSPPDTTVSANAAPPLSPEATRQLILQALAVPKMSVLSKLEQLDADLNRRLPR